MSTVQEIKSALSRPSLEERAELVALHRSRKAGDDRCAQFRPLVFEIIEIPVYYKWRRSALLSPISAWHNSLHKFIE